MKKIALQIQDNWMDVLEMKMTILEAEKESLIKPNAKIKSSLDANKDAIMIKWRDVLIQKTTKGNSNKVGAPKSTSKNALDDKELQERL